MPQRPVPDLQSGALRGRGRAARIVAAALTLTLADRAGAEDPDPISARIPAAHVEWGGAHNVIVGLDQSRLSISQSHRVGPEVVAAQKHINAASLSPGRTWRSEIDATIAGIAGEDFETEVSIGVFNTRRPIIPTRGGFGLTDLNLWRTNSVVDVGLAITAFEERLTYAAGVASSETAFEQRFTDEPWLWAFEPSGGVRDYRERSSAMFQKLEARLIDSATLDLSLSALYTRAGQDFRSFQTNTLADIYYEGESFNATAALETGGTSLSFAKEAHADRYYAFDEHTVRFERGAAALRLTLMREETREDTLVFYSDEIVRARLQFELAKIVPDAPAWLPDALAFGATQRASAEPTLFNSKDAVRRSFGVGAANSGERSSTDIYVYWNERNDPSEIGGFEAASEFGADIVQNFFFDHWDLSLYAMMSDMTRRRRFARDGDETLFSGGASFSKRFERLPDIRVSLDAFRYDAGSSREDYAFENHDLALRAEADLSEQLLSGLGYVVDDRRPYSIYAGVYNGWSVFDDSFSPAERERETRFLIMLRRGQ